MGDIQHLTSFCSTQQRSVRLEIIMEVRANGRLNVAEDGPSSQVMAESKHIPGERKSPFHPRSKPRYWR